MNRATFVFRHACKLGLEGIVSKRKDFAYRSGRSPDWLEELGRTADEARGGRGLGQPALIPPVLTLGRK